MSIDIAVRAPILVVPAEVCSESGPVFVLDMGRFKLATLLSEVPGQSPYDRYEVTIEDIGAVVVPNWSEWPVEETPNRLALIERFGVSINYEKCLVPNDPRFTDNKILIRSTKAISLNLSASQYREVATIVGNLLNTLERLKEQHSGVTGGGTMGEVRARALTNPNRAMFASPGLRGLRQGCARNASFNCLGFIQTDLFFRALVSVGPPGTACPS